MQLWISFWQCRNCNLHFCELIYRDKNRGRHLNTKCAVLDGQATSALFTPVLLWTPITIKSVLRTLNAVSETSTFPYDTNHLLSRPNLAAIGHNYNLVTSLLRFSVHPVFLQLFWVARRRIFFVNIDTQVLNIWYEATWALFLPTPHSDAFFVTKST